jgi:hypothetical protein
MKLHNLSKTVSQIPIPDTGTKIDSRHRCDLIDSKGNREPALEFHLPPVLRAIMDIRHEGDAPRPKFRRAMYIAGVMAVVSVITWVLSRWDGLDQIRQEYTLV